VYLENQFGDQKIVIGRAGRLLVPAAKRTREGTLFSRELGHYKLYQVLKGEPLEREVKLEDQFDRYCLGVYLPVLLAVPSIKHEWKEIGY
jgi:hypothetical protein